MCVKGAAVVYPVREEIARDVTAVPLARGPELGLTLASEASGSYL